MCFVIEQYRQLVGRGTCWSGSLEAAWLDWLECWGGRWGRVERERMAQIRVCGDQNCGTGLSVMRVLVLVIVGAVEVGVASGASAPAMEPSAEVGESGAEVGCSRPLVDVVWGFLLTLLALTVSLWGSFKQGDSDGSDKLGTLLIGVFAPLVDLLWVTGSSWACVAMVWSCHRLEGGEVRFPSFKWFKNLCSLLNPWSKSPARILSTCEIVMYVCKSQGPEELPNRESELLQQSWLWDEKVDVEDEREAMVMGDDIGAKKPHITSYYERKELCVDGKAALLWGEFFLEHDFPHRILPWYEKLKFLRGNSGFAVIAIAIQAIGYIYAAIFRSVKGLGVAPVEVIGLVFNIILLTKASVYSTSNPCCRLLVIYMDEEHERKLMDIIELKGRDSFDINVDFIRYMTVGSLLIISLCLYIPLIYYIVTLMRVTNIMIVMPLITFGVGLLVELIRILTIHILNVLHSGIFFAVCIVVNAVAYGWAIVVTLKSWKSQHFNTRPELLDLSQIIPFIG